MNTQVIRAILRKDLLAATRSKPIMLPLVLVPFLMLIVFPVGLIVLINNTDLSDSSTGADLDAMVEAMPEPLRSELLSYSIEERSILMATNYLLAPLYLFVPLIVAIVIAADSFAGEKERKTLEALLYTPTTDGQLLLAKTLSAVIPAVIVGLGGFVLYGVAVNLAAWPTMERIFFPNAMWVVLALWVGPAVAGLGLGIMVLVSLRVRGFQEAFQLGGVTVLPFTLIFIGQTAGIIYFSLSLVLLLGLVIWLINAALFWFGRRTFQRTELLARI